MMRLGLMGLAVVLASGVAMPAIAADIFEPPPVIEAPVQPVYQAPEVGGWYIRGDVDYHWTDFRRADYILFGNPGDVGRLNGDLKGALSLGAGIGYQIDDYFRVDLTGDYFFKSDFNGSSVGLCGGNPCTSTDRTSMQALLLLANAYIDLGTYYGITPYIGGGIGGAHVRWDDLHNDDHFHPPATHDGRSNWRFAYAAMAGASYCLTSNTKFDVGYRYSHINGGRMFDFAADTGPGYDGGFNVHEVRGGLRYQFSGSNGCEPPPPAVAYEPPPVYKQ